jgi:hypothetical protein
MSSNKAIGGGGLFGISQLHNRNANKPTLDATGSAMRFDRQVRQVCFVQMHG